MIRMSMAYVGDAGDEIANILFRVERRQGAAVGFGSFGEGGGVRLSLGNGGQEGFVGGAAGADDAQVFNGRAGGELFDCRKEWRGVGHGNFQWLVVSG